MYTSVVQYGSKLLVRGYYDGVQTERKISFEPTLFVTSSKEPSTKWKLLDGTPVYPISPGSMKECTEFVEKYKEVEGFNIYGNQNYTFQYISDTYKKEVPYDISLIRIFYIDIETSSEFGFPNTKNPNEEILCISLKDSKRTGVKTWGTKKYSGNQPGYVYCQDEEELFLRFFKYWTDNYPDIVTGWNSNFFDIAYIVARGNRVLGEDATKKLSPWGLVWERYVKVVNREELTYDIKGVACLDYLDLYKKYTYDTQEKYTLDHIAEVELGKNKLVMPGKDFKDNYTNYWDTFVEYNRVDVDIVVELEDKMRLIELAVAIAYKAKVNFDDVFSPIKLWENIAYNHLKERGIVPPNRRNNVKAESFEGAYVKESIAGKHKWVASFDLNSLYPHLIMQYNISPETILNEKVYSDVDSLLEQKIDTGFLKERDVTMTANGYLYRKDVKGFLAELMESVYNDRSRDKKLMLKAQQEYENTKDSKYLKDVSRLNNAQMAAKILLNSAYGACGNSYFLYFDVRMAEGITTSGQLSVRWVANRINEFLNTTFKTNKDYVIAIDTDSNYISFENIVEDLNEGKTVEQKIKYLDQICDKVIQPVIDKAFKELAEYMNVYENKMVMKRESLADTTIFVGKKRYIMSVHNNEGVQYKEPKIKVVGLNMIKSSTPNKVRERLRKSIEIFLHKTEKDLHKFSMEFREEFNTLSPEQMAFPTSIKGTKKYAGSPIYASGTPIHVRAALVYNHQVNRLGLKNKYPLIKDGDKIKYCYLKMPNKFRENIIGFIDHIPEEFGLDDYIDYDTMFEKTYISNIEPVTKVLKWNTEEKVSLEEFFG